MKKLVLFLALLLPGLALANSNVCNVTYIFSDFGLTTQAVRRVSQTPLYKLGDYNGAILAPNTRSTITDTNGSATFSNTVSGYSYRVQLDTPYGSTVRTCGFPASLTGSVNGGSYLGDIYLGTFYFLQPTNVVISQAALPLLDISSKGIRNGLSVITNNGARYGPDTPGTATSGIQEALNSIGTVAIGSGTVGAELLFGPGDFFYTNEIYYSNGSVTHIKLQGAGFLASRLVYAGNLSTNLMTFTGRPDSGGGTLHFDARDVTFTSITNGNSIFLRITNDAHTSIEYCNFSGWQITTNTDWGASVSIPGLPANPQGGVGIVFGTSLSHAEFIRNCYFAGLACGIVMYGDHFYGENIKFADIGMYGSLSEGTAWPNTSAFSLGAAYLRPVAGLNTDIFRTHLYQCNGGFVYLTAGGGHLTEIQLETCDHPFAVLSGSGGTFYMDIGANASSGGPFDSSQRYSLTTSPYAYGSANNANITVYAALSSTLYQGTIVNGQGSVMTNFSLFQADKINIGRMTSTNIAGVRNTNDTAVFGQVGTNLIYLSGGGTANAMGLYVFNREISGPPNHFIIWTNVNGLNGIINDPSLHVYANEWSVTNNSAAPAYVYTAGAGGDTYPINPWTSAGGSGSGSPTSVNGTNYYTNNFTAYYNLDGTAPASVNWGTNILFVNRASPFANDTNATAGNADRPWQSVSNALASAQSNQIVFVYPGYYTNAPDNAGLTIPNNVTLMGWSPQSVRIGGQAGAEPTMTLKTNANAVGFSGFMNLTLGSPGATVQSVQATGQIDCLLISGPATNILIRDSAFAVIGADTSALIDAGVITVYSSNTVSIVNSVFETRKQTADTTSTKFRRALVVNSGIVDIRGGKLIARDSYNSIGISHPGSIVDAAKITFGSDVMFDVGTTNSGGSAWCITNSPTNPGVFVATGVLPFPTNLLSGAITFSNAFPASNIFGLTFSQINATAPSAIITNGSTLTWNGAGISNNWVMTPLFGGIQNVQLQNGNRFASAIGGNGTTNLGFLVASPLPSGGYLSNLSVYASTNSFSTTNYTFTLLTNANPTAGVASLLTGTLLGVTASPSTNFAGVSCILTANTNTMGTMQILNSVANSTAPMSFWWRMEWWHQQFNP